MVSLLRVACGIGWNMVCREETAHIHTSKGDRSSEFDTYGKRWVSGIQRRTRPDKQMNSRTLWQTSPVLKRRVGEGSAGR